jgi:hypothetical protein
MQPTKINHDDGGNARQGTPKLANFPGTEFTDGG